MRVSAAHRCASSSAPRHLPPAAAPVSAPTAEPVGGDVLQHCEGDAEEGDEEVAERQGADEYVGDGPHGFAAGHHVEHQAVAEERQGEDEHADEDEGQLGAPRQLRDVHKGLQPIQGDELLPRHVVVPQELRELLRGDVQGPHSTLLSAASSAPPPLQRFAGARGETAGPAGTRHGGRGGGAETGADGAGRPPPRGTCSGPRGRGGRRPISAQRGRAARPRPVRRPPAPGRTLRGAPSPRNPGHRPRAAPPRCQRELELRRQPLLAFGPG